MRYNCIFCGRSYKTKQQKERCEFIHKKFKDRYYDEETEENINLVLKIASSPKQSRLV